MNFFLDLNQRSKYLFLFIILVISANLLIIDFFLANQFLNSLSSDLQGKQSQNSQEISTLQQESVSKTVATNSCPVACLTEITQAISSIKKPKEVSVANTDPISNSAKEYFIPLGGGASTANDWTDVPGSQVYINSTAYPNIKSVVFEASVYIPTGNQTAYVRLFNKTDQHPVWFSEVSLEGGAPQLLISKPITLDLGNKLYQVQMKTSLKYTANLVESRVHIFTY